MSERRHAEEAESCPPGEHSLVWSDDRFMLVCEDCGRSARTISNDVRSSADRS